MSKIEELINQLCPDGVEHVKIGEVVSYEQPTKYLVQSTDYNDSFTTPVLTAGQSFILGYTDEITGIYNATIDNPVIIFDDFTAAFKWVDFKFKVKSSAMKMLTADESKTTLRYIFHIMGYLNFSSNEHKRLWIGTYSNFIIPLPPLPIQEEIVRILDSMTTLTAELTAELKARQKQYEYYRDSLLSFKEGDAQDGVRWMKLGDVASYSKDRVLVADVDSNTYVGVDNLMPNKQGKKASVCVPESGTLTGFVPDDILIGNIRPYLKKIWLANCAGGTNGDVLTIRINDTNVLLPKYLYYHLSSDDFFAYDMQHAKGAKMPRGSKEAVMNYMINVPPLEEQQRIVDILDRFDKLCNDISEGLPAEIEARKKQYEYYRDKLLAFKEKEV